MERDEYIKILKVVASGIDDIEASDADLFDNMKRTPIVLALQIYGESARKFPVLACAHEVFLNDNEDLARRFRVLECPQDDSLEFLYEVGGQAVVNEISLYFIDAVCLGTGQSMAE
jgi:hypothetical protein